MVGRQSFEAAKTRSNLAQAKYLVVFASAICNTWRAGAKMDP